MIYLNSKEVLKIGRRVLLIPEDAMKCFKILVANSLTIPPRSEIIAFSNNFLKENESLLKGF